MCVCSTGREHEAGGIAKPVIRGQSQQSRGWCCSEAIGDQAFEPDSRIEIPVDAGGQDGNARKHQICIEAVRAAADRLGNAGGHAQLWERLVQNSAADVRVGSIERSSSTLARALR